jgi:signal transduction histidine kinase
MSHFPASTATAGDSVVDVMTPVSRLRARVTTQAAQRAVAALAVPLAASAVWLAATSDHVQHPTATALYRGYQILAPMLIGLYWWRRRPASRFGPLLISFGLVAWIWSWLSSDAPLAFDLGVLAEAPLTVLTFWLFIAFPSGRLTTFADRFLVGAWAVIMAGFFLPWALGSPVIAGGGPLSACVPGCPRNVLQVGSAPDLVTTLGNWETYLGVALTVAGLIVYALRLRTASRPRRRALVAVAATSLLFLPTFLVFHVSAEILELDPSTLKSMSWVLVGARVLLPLGFLAALLQADLFAGRARGRLLGELAQRSTPERWRTAVAGALDDDALRLAYWDPRSARYLEPGGGELIPGAAGPDRTVLRVDRDHQPVAAMDVDAALGEDPELVRAATSATLLAVENGNLEGELRASRGRIAAAGDAARQQIERDIHDSAQQRLVALRIHLTLAGEGMAEAEQRLVVERLGDELEEAIDDLREVARGAYPKSLAALGLGAALRGAARNAAIPARVEDRGVKRHSQQVESTVYFVCLEALQNASKHAGRDATAVVRLSEDRDTVYFSVQDDGVGFVPQAVAGGAGLGNIADRVAAAGGTVTVDSADRAGTLVRGQVPG